MLIDIIAKLHDNTHHAVFLEFRALCRGNGCLCVDVRTNLNNSKSIDECNLSGSDSGCRFIIRQFRISGNRARILRISKGLIIHCPSFCTGNPPNRILRGKFGTVSQFNTVLNADCILCIRGGNVCRHHLTLAAYGLIQPLNKCNIGFFNGCGIAIISDDIPIIRFNSRHKCRIISRRRCRVCAASKRSSSRSIDCTGTAKGYPCIRHKFRNRVYCLGINCHAFNDG